MTDSQLMIEPLNEHFGARITGIDLKTNINPTLAKQLNQCLSQYAVLVFPQQHLDPKAFQAFGEIFGQLMPQQFKKYILHDHPLIGFNSTRDLPKKNGRLQVRGENFHTDHSNETAPPKATALVAVEIPSHGGDTQFIDVRRSFDTLSQSLKTQALGRFAWHVHTSSRSPRTFTQISAEEMAKMPSALQPLVIQHPESGRSALYLNTGRMEQVEGMSVNEGFQLIDQLYAHAISDNCEYRHQWKVGDVVIWDNRSVMHQANADYDPEEFRYLYRLMVSGVPLQAAANPDSM